jgi:glycosyltransferase involved in cell wall biosynthesis
MTSPNKTQHYLSILVGPEDQGRIRDIEVNLAPRLEYRLVAEHCRGEIKQCHPSPAALHGPKLVRLWRSLSTNTQIAAQVIRSTPPGSVIYSTGETWGLPMAMVGGVMARRHHVQIMYVHRLYSVMWLRLIHHLRALMPVDGWICATRYQASLLRQALGSNETPIAVISQGVDTTFFDPRKAKPERRSPYLLAVGGEMRNYSLLFEAVRNLDIDLVVKASSTWMVSLRQQVTSIPPNVRLLTGWLSYSDLRDLYAGASLVIVPLFDTPQAAGITTILEAMAMRKCVVATNSRGLPDALIPGTTGIITESSSSQLSQALKDLLSQTEKIEQLAMDGYESVREKVNLEAHALAIERFIAELSSQP